MTPEPRPCVSHVAINGRFLSQPTTGVQRYARQIVQGLDRLLSDQAEHVRPRLELFVPPNADVTGFPLQNIKIRCVGQREGVLWEQVDLAWFARNCLLVSLANSGPMLHRRQIVALHDAAVHAVPQCYSSKFRTWYRLLHGRLARHACRLVTVSRFSAGELEQYYRVAPGETVIVPNAAQHILNVTPQNSILSKHGIQPGGYVFSFGSRNRSKNVALVEQAMELLPEPRPVLIVAGRINSAIFTDVAATSRLPAIHIGPIADEELRALYENALCFVLPSFYEGFGIPALEAMACGCPVVVARAASLPEVCSNAALYCDPTSPPDLARKIRTLQTHPARRRELQERGRSRALEFSWDVSAAQMLGLICEEIGFLKAVEVSEWRSLKVGTA